MSDYLLIRVDDRLLHGQVALGWRHALDPQSFLIVDDEVARDPLAISLFDAALPEGMRMAVLDVPRFIQIGAEVLPPERTILLIRELTTLESLVENGFRPAAVNLGGIHHREGSVRVLDYLFLTEEDRAIVRRLTEAGIEIFAQDLPSSPRRRAEKLIDTGGEPR